MPTLYKYTHKLFKTSNRSNNLSNNLRNKIDKVLPKTHEINIPILHVVQKLD